MSSEEQWVINNVNKIKELLLQGSASEKASDSPQAINIYSEVINLIAATIDKMKQPPFSSPDSIDQLGNIALFVASRVRLLSLASQQASAGIAALIKNDSTSILNHIRSKFEEIQKAVDEKDSMAMSGLGDFIMKESLNGFDQLFGNEEIVKKLKSFKRAPVKKSTLLYGPPGSGKTSFAKALAKDMNLNFRIIDVSQLLSPYQGKTEQNVKQVFDQIKNKTDELVLLDEAETLIQDRNNSQSAITSASTVVSVFLVQLESMKNPAHLVLTTNYANRVDPAIMRRLNALFIPYPEPGMAAYDVFNRILQTYYLQEIDSNQWANIKEAFLEFTVNKFFSPADFATAIDQQMLSQFEMDPLLGTCGIKRGSSNNKIYNTKDGDFCMIDPNGSIISDGATIIPHPFTYDDVLSIIKTLHPSVTPEQYQEYKLSTD